MELQQDHSRTLVQVERLKRALDEHNLELRVKAANEVKAACEQRLAAAETEISEHRQRLDDSERFVLCPSDISYDNAVSSFLFFSSFIFFRPIDVVCAVYCVLTPALIIAMLSLLLVLL